MYIYKIRHHEYTVKQPAMYVKDEQAFVHTYVHTYCMYI